MGKGRPAGSGRHCCGAQGRPTGLRPDGSPGPRTFESAGRSPDSRTQGKRGQGTGTRRIMGEDRRAEGLSGLPFSNERIRGRADYDRVRANFRWQCPENFNFGFDVVDGWAAASPHHTALHWIGPTGERTITYGQLAERSGRFARALRSLSLAPGERVLVILPRVPEWWDALIGLL